MGKKNKRYRRQQQNTQKQSAGRDSDHENSGNKIKCNCSLLFPLALVVGGKIFVNCNVLVYKAGERVYELCREALPSCL